MSDMGWTQYDAAQEEIEAHRFGTCLICGKRIDEVNDGETTEVSNGPGEPTIGAAHVACFEDEDPQELRGADHYHSDYPDFIVNDIGEREL